MQSLTAFTIAFLFVGASADWTMIAVSNGGRWGSWGPVELCPRGTKARGFSIKVEAPQGGGDDTALNGISLYCLGSTGNTVESSVGR
jgi:Vitelline membrane outer layer protein I (VOMI)